MAGFEMAGIPQKGTKYRVDRDYSEKDRLYYDMDNKLWWFPNL
jgi:hypothetical protein